MLKRFVLALALWACPAWLLAAQVAVVDANGNPIYGIPVATYDPITDTYTPCGTTSPQTPAIEVGLTPVEVLVNPSFFYAYKTGWTSYDGVISGNTTVVLQRQ